MRIIYQLIETDYDGSDNRVVATLDPKETKKNPTPEEVDAWTLKTIKKKFPADLMSDAYVYVRKVYVAP